jgi:hypothetical protein
MDGRDGMGRHPGWMGWDGMAFRWDGMAWMQGMRMGCEDSVDGGDVEDSVEGGDVEDAVATWRIQGGAAPGPGRHRRLRG